MAVSGTLSPISGQIMQLLIQLAKGNLTFIFSKKSGKSQGISETSGCGNHVTFSSLHNS